MERGIKRLPRRTRCRRILPGTRAGQRLDLRYLARLSGEKIIPNPKVLSCILPVLPYLDSAQFNLCMRMNRAARAKREERYREISSRRNEVITTIVELLRQPDELSLSKWVCSNHARIKELIPVTQREEAIWELQNLYLFPALKSSKM